MIKLLQGKIKRLLHWHFLTGLLALALTSCYKSPKQLGADLLPQDSRLKVAYSDTATIYARSIPIDSVRTDELSQAVVGSLNDPVFGRTTAGFYTRFELSSKGHDFGTNPILDSLVLQLYYSRTYGDTMTTLTLHTYEMLESIYYDSVYYSNTVIPVGGTDYSNLTFEPRPHDSIPVFPDTIKNIIRIRLSDQSAALGEKLLHAPEEAMSDNDQFAEYFKGLYLVTEPVDSKGVLLFYDLISHFSNLTLYYSNDEQDSLKYQYLITVTTPRINKYEHDHELGSPEFVQQVLQGDTALGQEKVYVQGMSGVKTEIFIPHIRDYASLGTIAINEAILELPGSDEDSFFDAPAKMVLVRRLREGYYDLLPDQEEGDLYFGGKYNASKNMYQFRITRFIQSLLIDTAEVNNGFYLFPSGGSLNPQRFIFNGPQPGNDTVRAMKLKIVYTDTD